MTPPINALGGGGATLFSTTTFLTTTTLLSSICCSSFRSRRRRHHHHHHHRRRRRSQSFANRIIRSLSSGGPLEEGTMRCPFPQKRRRGEEETKVSLTKTTTSTTTHKIVASKTVLRSEMMMMSAELKRRRTTTTEGKEEEEEVIKPMRIADILMVVFPERFPTKTAAKKAIRRGDVRVNEKTADVGFEVQMKEDDEERLKIDIRARMNANAAQFNNTTNNKNRCEDVLPKEIREGDNATTVAYEDEECAVVRKSFGIPTLKTKTNKNKKNNNNNNNKNNKEEELEEDISELAGWNLDRVLPYIVKPAENVEGALHRPRPVHRLDSLTGGLVVCAKTRRASKTLSEAFRDRAARKRYRAVLIEYANHRKGGLGKRKINEKRGTITSKDMGPNNDQYAETEFAICDETNEDDNDGGNAIAKVLIDFYPKTGRTHQLRRHAEKQLNMPILGDTRYGDKAHRENAKQKNIRLHLFAAEITLPAEAMPWRDAGGEPLNVRVSEPAFFKKSMDASDVFWNASTL